MAIIVEGTPAYFTTNPNAVGTIIGFPKPFTAINGTIVDPDLVYFSYSVNRGAKTTYTWTNPTGDPQSMIVHDGVGLFHIILATAGLAGNWQYSWSCAPANGGPDSTSTEVVWESSIYVGASSL